MRVCVCCVCTHKKGWPYFFATSPYVAYMVWPSLLEELRLNLGAPSGANLCLLTINDDNNCLFRLCQEKSSRGREGEGAGITSAQFRPVLVTDRGDALPQHCSLGFVLGLRPPRFNYACSRSLSSCSLSSCSHSPTPPAAGPGALELTVASVFAIYTNAIRCHVPIFILR